MSYRAEPRRVALAGRAALAALRSGTARVFASFERSCYVETPCGIACLGGAGLGLGPLNAIVERFEAPPVGCAVAVATGNAKLWRPPGIVARGTLPEVRIPEAVQREAGAFLSWLCNDGPPPDGLIGLGPGLTPAGDDFVGGAMIALRAFGHAPLADRIAAWALPLAETNTSRISRAHLACAAAGEGHEALHLFLLDFGQARLEQLARIGHTSGLDAAAGALAALRLVGEARRDAAEAGVEREVVGDLEHAAGHQRRRHRAAGEERAGDHRARR